MGYHVHVGRTKAVDPQRHLSILCGKGTLEEAKAEATQYAAKSGPDSFAQVTDTEDDSVKFSVTGKEAAASATPAKS